MLNLRRFFTLILSFILLLPLNFLFAQNVSANTSYDLDFHSLPSAQGWIYSTGDTSVDTDFFSIDGTQLHMNTIGSGYSGHAYLLSMPINPNLPFTLSVRARVNNYEVQSNNNPWGFTFAVMSDTHQFDLGISPGIIRGGDGDTLLSTTVDVTQFHTYKIEGKDSDPLYKVYVDDVLIGTTPSRPLPSVLSSGFYLGDGTGGANADVDITSFHFEQQSPVTEVTIDIKPGSSLNSINLGSNGNVPVAILSTATFDATTVDPLSLTLAGAQVELKGKGTPMVSFEDVNGDGLLDLVAHVSTEALQLTENDTQAVLKGQTFAGELISGTDSIRIVQ